MLEAAKASELWQKQQERELQLQQIQLMHQRQAAMLQPQIQQQIQQQTPLEELDPSMAVLLHIQQALTSGAAPSMVVAPTHIPLYPGYAQVPAGPGYIKDNPKHKYIQLLQVLDEMSKEVRPSYAGNKISSDRFKRGIAQARILLRECMLEHSPNTQR